MHRSLTTSFLSWWLVLFVLKLSQRLVFELPDLAFGFPHHVYNRYQTHNSSKPLKILSLQWKFPPLRHLRLNYCEILWNLEMQKARGAGWNLFPVLSQRLKLKLVDCTESCECEKQVIRLACTHFLIQVHMTKIFFKLRSWKSKEYLNMKMKMCLGISFLGCMYR